MGDVPAFVDSGRAQITSASERHSVMNRVVNLVASGSAWPSANLAIFIPFRVAAPYTVQQIYWQNMATINGNIDVGIYDSEGNKIVSSGSTAQSGATALQSISITPTTLRRGQYYLAMAFDNATATVRAGSSAATLYRAIGVLSMVSAFPLPSTATFVGTLTNYYPFIGLSQQSVL